MRTLFFGKSSFMAHLKSVTGLFFIIARPEKHDQQKCELADIYKKQ